MPPVASSLLPSPWPKGQSLVHAMYTSRGRHDLVLVFTAPPASSCPTCRCRDLLLLLRRLRPPSHRLSAPVIEKQTARTSITVVGYDQGDTQCAPSPTRKIPRTTEKKGEDNERIDRRGRRETVPWDAPRIPRPCLARVYRGKRERTCALTWIEYCGARLEKGS